ncbi:hypothetical protein [Pseudonocardia asaccharolytica]|uniref:Uncharacterized protein n=1 Tax=Pseudonocardia asaccharolytica DSM 44247 = NBRC 16224 TaxID=1123024 RepID=A0A511D8I5_9PSEU|nr:hypothetical protein [Pseudonocardia asaccharolytica]GEL19248.1 hypothetical protein PA7_30850 [Pseudonocardia asaccharolytica DSM 44247 = NBRC 16224]
MGLTGLWIKTLHDGLVRADQVIGIESHSTPELAGKPPHWLLNVVLAVPTGCGGRHGWDITALHRTLVQSSTEAVDAPVELAKVLAQLGTSTACGVVTASERSGTVRFAFEPFEVPAPV